MALIKNGRTARTSKSQEHALVVGAAAAECRAPGLAFQSLATAEICGTCFLPLVALVGELACTMGNVIATWVPA